jgi:hypothetical protein
METWEAEGGEVGSGERKVERFARGETPRAVGTASRLGRQVTIDPTPDELGKAPTPALPLLPH